MKDWCANGLSGEYRLSGSDFDYEEAIAKTDIPILAVNIKGDDFAPVAATKNLTSKFKSNNSIQHSLIEEQGIGHFNWARKPKSVVDLAKNWIRTL